MAPEVTAVGAREAAAPILELAVIYAIAHGDRRVPQNLCAGCVIPSDSYFAALPDWVPPCRAFNIIATLLTYHSLPYYYYSSSTCHLRCIQRKMAAAASAARGGKGASELAMLKSAEEEAARIVAAARDGTHAPRRRCDCSFRLDAHNTARTHTHPHAHIPTHTQPQSARRACARRRRRRRARWTSTAPCVK